MPLEQVYGDTPQEEVTETPTETEAVVEEPAEEVVEETTEEAVEYSEEEQSAMAKGWKPDGVEGKPNISAGEFLRRESLFDRIHKLERMVENSNSTIDEMAAQHKKLAELERTKLMDELKAQKKTALAEEDYDAVIDLDERLAEVRSEEVEDTSNDVGDYVNPAFNDWAARNTWYNQDTNPAIYQEATALGYAYAQQTGKDGAEVYDYVERTMKTLHPELGGSAPKNKPNAVEGAATPTPRKKAGPARKTKKDLTDVQRRVMDRYVKTGVMSEQEYIDELIKIGEL